MIRNLILYAGLVGTVAAADPSAFIGRWDLEVHSNGETFPGWMEVSQNGTASTVRFQPRGGAVRSGISPVAKDGKLTFTLVPGSATQPATTWEWSATGDKLTGAQQVGGIFSAEATGVRAPKLARSAPSAWGPEEPIFNGKDLTGWEAVTHPEASHWVAKNGELVNESKGSNLKTTRTFNDFQLHIEFMCPEHCNSGIYLRGRYEIQVGTEGGTQPSHEMGAVYGFTPPSVEMPMGNGEWQVMDITLTGRTLTVVRNGKTIHDHIEIAGTTGGALDSHEAEPGPFYLQGDHTGGLRYRNIRVRTPKR